MLLRLIVILFLIYVVVRLFQRFDNFLKGRNRPSGSGRDIPPRRQDRYRDRVEDARWEDVSDPPQRRR